MNTINNLKRQFQVLILTIILSMGTAHAQTPGFMGKKFMVGFSAPVIASWNFADESPSYPVFDNNGIAFPERAETPNVYYKIKPTLYIEYVVNRKSSFQLFARYFKSKVDLFSMRVQDTLTGSSVLLYPSGPTDISTTSFGFKYRLTKGEGLNPVGRYMTLGLEYTNSKFDLTDIKFYEYASIAPYPASPDPENHTTWVPTIGFGKISPMGKFLLFDLGIDFGLPLSHIGFPYMSEYSQSEWARGNSKRHLFRSYFISINLGLSFLAF